MNTIQTERLILHLWKPEDTQPFWAVMQDPKVTEFYPGPSTWNAHFSPAIDIVWRFGSHYWDKGYASKAAKAVLNYAWNTLNILEIVAFTVPANKRSISVMENIGMTRDFNGNFTHPKLPVTHPLSHHILYSIQKPHQSYLQK